MEHLVADKKVSQRRACRVVSQPRCTQRYRPRRREADEVLSRRLLDLAASHPRYGYRRMTALLRQEGYEVNRKRVRRLLRRAGLKVARVLHRRRARGASDNSCQRARSQHPHDVWCVDFLFDRTSDGRAVKIVAVLDEHTRQCVALRAARSLVAGDVREVLRQAMAEYEAPRRLRCDNGSELTASSLQAALAALHVRTLFIAPGSPWENGYQESFNGKLRDELLDLEVCDTLREEQALLDGWREHYNHRRPHSALGYLAPVVFAARA